MNEPNQPVEPTPTALRASGAAHFSFGQKLMKGGPLLALAVFWLSIVGSLSLVAFAVFQGEPPQVITLLPVIGAAIGALLCWKQGFDRYQSEDETFAGRGVIRFVVIVFWAPFTLPMRSIELPRWLP